MAHRRATFELYLDMLQPWSAPPPPSTAHRGCDRALAHVAKRRSGAAQPPSSVSFSNACSGVMGGRARAPDRLAHHACGTRSRPQSAVECATPCGLALRHGGPEHSWPTFGQERARAGRAESGRYAAAFGLYRVTSREVELCEIPAPRRKCTTAASHPPKSRISLRFRAACIIVLRLTHIFGSFPR